MNDSLPRTALAATLATLVLALAAAATLTACGASAAAPPPTATAAADPDTLRLPPDAPQLAMIRATVLPAAPVPLAEPLSGRLAYDEDATARIGVSLSGRIVALKAAPGDRVRAGQMLAEIDSPDVGAAVADLAKAQADEAMKHAALARARELGSGEAIAARELEGAQDDLAQAQAERERAARRLANLNPQGLAVRGQRVALASPLAGVVTERTATPALEVGPGLAAPLFVVTDPHRLWVMIDLPEPLLARVKAGGTVDVESDAWPGEHFPARIVQVGAVVDPNSRRVVARALLDNPAGKLLPEMFVRASVLRAGAAGVRVPDAALVLHGAQASVFVQAAPGEFHRRAVTLATHGADESVVASGLAGGERVVTTGALLLDGEIAARTGGGS